MTQSNVREQSLLFLTLTCAMLWFCLRLGWLYPIEFKWMLGSLLLGFMAPCLFTLKWPVFYLLLLLLYKVLGVYRTFYY